MANKRGTAERIFNIINNIILFLLIIITLYPVYLIFIISISHGIDVMKGSVAFYPVNITLATYKTIFQGELFMYMRNSVFYTIFGTAINLVMSSLCAYPLSRQSFSGRKFFTTMVTITLFFSGGMIPLYLAIKQYGMINTRWALLIPPAINTYNMIIIRTSFQSIPDSLIESAYLDGANDIVVLTRIVIPLSKATLATMLLFYAVSHWNSYFDAMLYLNRKDLQPLQILLRNLLVAGAANEDLMVATSTHASFAVTDRTMRAATIVVSTLPILVVYPFVQRYFVKGVMIGSIKG
jgi:putative aldouronate transport system permease protein